MADGDIGDIIGQILSSKEGIDAITGLVRTLRGSKQDEDAAAAEEPALIEPQTADPPNEEPEAEGSPLAGLLGGIMKPDGGLEKLLSGFGIAGRVPEEKLRLLEALKHHVSPRRRAKIERAVHIVRTACTVRAAIGALGGLGGILNV